MYYMIRGISVGNNYAQSKCMWIESNIFKTLNQSFTNSQRGGL